MKLSRHDIDRLSKLAISAAMDAGKMINAYSGKKHDVKNKTGGTSLASQVVTEVDLLSQNIILDILKPTCDEYGLAMLTEESHDDKSRLEKGHFWCIDPLDGTLPFIEGNPGYAVSIALVSRTGVPILGVVYDPSTQALYSAIAGQGAFKSNVPISLDKGTSEQKPLTFIIDKGFKKHKHYKEVLNKLTSFSSKLGYDGLKIIDHGGAALNACWVLDSPPACYFKFPKTGPGGGSLWDFAATTCIFNESGAIATDIYGGPLELNRPDSTFMNHNGALFSSGPEIARFVTDLYLNFK